MPPEMRKAKVRDLPEIARLNNLEAQYAGERDQTFFKRYLKIPYFLVSEDPRGLSGFIMVMSPQVEYDSPNFGWFQKNIPSFIYIDRVIVRQDVRNNGIASAFYQKLEEERGRIPLTAEVSILNENSMSFHLRRGFHEIGRFAADGKKECIMLKKD